MFKIKAIYQTKPAIVSESTSVTYSDLSRICNDFSRIFTGKNLILHMCTNTIGAIAGYSAFLNNGQAVMMADAEADEKILVNITGTYMPDYIFLPKKLYALCRDYHVVTRLCDYVLVKTKFKSDEKINNELALLLPTSGTTGSNKYVRISYKNLISNAESIIEYLQIDEHQKTITTLRSVNHKQLPDCRGYNSCN